MWGTFYEAALAESRQTQMLVKWVRAADMITWLFKTKQLQTEATVTMLSMPDSVKHWTHVEQFQLGGYWIRPREGVIHAAKEM